MYLSLKHCGGCFIFLTAVLCAAAGDIEITDGSQPCREPSFRGEKVQKQ